MDILVPVHAEDYNYVNLKIFSTIEGIYLDDNDHEVTIVFTRPDGLSDKQSFKTSLEKNKWPELMRNLYNLANGRIHNSIAKRVWKERAIEDSKKWPYGDSEFINTKKFFENLPRPGQSGPKIEMIITCEKQDDGDYFVNITAESDRDVLYDVASSILDPDLVKLAPSEKDVEFMVFREMLNEHYEQLLSQN